MKKTAVFLALILLLLTFSGCKGSPEVNKANRVQGYVYPYAYSLVNKADEQDIKYFFTPERDSSGAYYPFSYYSYSGDMQEAYRRITTALYSFNNEVILSDIKVVPEDMVGLFRIILEDNPDFYYVETSLNYDITDDYFVKYLTLTYTLTKEEVKTNTDKLNALVASIKSDLPDDISLYDTYLYLHDFIVMNEIYDESLSNPNDSNVIGCLIDKSGTCASFARGFQYLCRQFDIITCLKTGVIGESHLWNVVPYADTWMHIDVGMDNVDSVHVSNLTKHNLFGLSDEFITTTGGHEFFTADELNYLYNVPACSDDNLKFLSKQNYIIEDTENTAKAASQLESWLKTALHNGIPYVEVKAVDYASFKYLKETLLNTDRAYIWSVVDACAEDYTINTENVGVVTEDWDSSALIYLFPADSNVEPSETNNSSNYVDFVITETEIKQ